MTGLEITPGTWLLVTVVGAFVGLDGISWPQAMASRPIVAATLGGLIFGDPASGFLVGAWLEIVAARHPPFGAARYPETGPAALIAGSGLALSQTGSIVALLTCVIAGWTIGWIGSHSIGLLRTYNGRLVGDPSTFSGDPAEIVRRHRRSLRLDALRAAAITGALFVPVTLSVRTLEALPGGSVGGWLTPLVSVLGLAALGGVGARVLGGRREGWPPFAIGAGAALVIVWATG